MITDSNIFSKLNDAQAQAVKAPATHQLILAGAGSGKTRVLVNRIAWLLTHEQISPYAILAVTFTNKAAGEMRDRIENMLQQPIRQMWIGTFHGIAHRLLRAHWQAAGLSENFQIIDADDQYRLIRRILNNLNLDEKKWPVKQLQWYINGKKEEGLRPQHINCQQDIVSRTQLSVYTAYEDACQRSDLVDFSELLLRAHELWLEQPDILTHYQQRFSHILVDEFQDTNALQYAWIRLLANQGNNYVMAVGDDDQSIYGWRGARVDNMHHFTRDFPETATYHLEQNYRSTSTILNAANAIIANNSTRLGDKKLWTDGKTGEPIAIYSAFNETDEALFILQRIKEWIDNGNRRDDIAILYRSNAQSRILEETLLQNAIPYRVYGGLRFFDRAEIKDALAYLRLLLNRHDDAAFERVVNTPTRGIGDKTMTILRHHAREKAISLWHACELVLHDQALPTRAHKAIDSFMQLIINLNEKTHGATLSDLSQYVIEHSGLLTHYQKDVSERGRNRIDNLQELVTAVKQYTPDEADHLPPLAAFLSHTMLESSEDKNDIHSDCVQLMTLHSAKGLEFPFVIICGLEQGLFPHFLSADDELKLEEERRLCYVGMTRAMEKLILTHAENRQMYGKDNRNLPSRFLQEIPSAFTQEVRMRSRVKHTSFHQPQHNIAKTSQKDHLGLALGQQVTHATFGEGTVLNLEGSGNNTRVQVRFQNGSCKWLVATFAKLTIKA